VWTKGKLVSKVQDGKEQAGAKFADYFDFREPLTKLPSHRILALFRGEKEEMLSLNMVPEEVVPGQEPAVELRASHRASLQHRG